MPRKVDRYKAAVKAAFDALAVAEVRQEGGRQKLTIGGAEVNDQMLKELTTEVVFLRQSKIWKIVNASVKARAIDLGLVKATDFDQVLFAKAAIWAADIGESLLVAVENEAKARNK